MNSDDRSLDSRREALEEKLARRAEARVSEETSSKKSDSTGFARGLKIASEFVAGVVVGAGIGYMLDWALETTPWMMIVFLLLGFAAGVLNVLRAEGMIRKKNL